MGKRVYAILPLGGKGRRFDSETPKQLLPFAGKPLFRHPFDVLAKRKDVRCIVLAVLSGYEAMVADAINGFDNGKDIVFVPGGESRFESVKNAIMALDGEGIALIHDGDRPFLSDELIDRCLESANKEGSGVAAIKSTDSIIEVKDGTRYLERESIYRVQTPQCFDLKSLQKAYGLVGNKQFKDEGSLYLSAYGRLSLVEGDGRNVKIDVREDAKLYFGESYER